MSNLAGRERPEQRTPRLRWWAIRPYTLLIVGVLIPSIVYLGWMVMSAG